MPGKSIRVAIDFSYDEFLPFYEGRVKDVIAPGLDGKSVRFPAHTLRPYLTHSGIAGIFELRMDQNNRLLSCERIADIGR